MEDTGSDREPWGGSGGQGMLPGGGIGLSVEVRRMGRSWHSFEFILCPSCLAVGPSLWLEPYSSVWSFLSFSFFFLTFFFFRLFKFF